MKKFLAIAVIAGSMVACGNKGDKKVDETKSSDTTKVITTDTATVVTDTTVKTTITTDTLKKN
jgi:predicted small lipoprotein YifL